VETVETPIPEDRRRGPDPADAALPSPRALRRELPLPPRARAAVARGREAVRDALHGRDRRLVVIAGPCSIHDPGAALDYAARLAELAARLADRLVVVMRTFLEKPRTATGWKGLLSDPHLDGSGDVAAGLRAARRLLAAVGALGLPCAAEVLDPVASPFLADALAWGGIGARTSESQVHRQLASGLPYPVGFKNGTGGCLAAASNAMLAAGRPHRFPGVGPDGRVRVVATRGNPDRHIVLRGGTAGPNYGEVSAAAARVADQGIARPVLVDCSHDNSGHDPARQGAVCRAVLRARREGQTPLLGVMLESFLEPGRQDFAPGRALRYGVSITDACMGWSETAELLREAAEG
jgi:3-deoxy-7-phosphoheptulonate synthase